MMARTHFHSHTATAGAEASPETLAHARILALLGGRVGAARAGLFQYFLDGGRHAFRLQADWHAGPAAAVADDPPLADELRCTWTPCAAETLSWPVPACGRGCICR